MFGESESESPRVPSPWDSLISIPPSPIAGPRRTHTPSPLAAELIPRLVPEADDGNVEYKLQLLNPSAARFARLVTQMKWRLLEGGGQAYYELGVADSGDLIGLPREELEQSLETLEMMAGEIGASVIVVKEIEVPAVMARLAKRSGEWAGAEKRAARLEGGTPSSLEGGYSTGGYSTVADTETDPDSLSGTEVDLNEDLSVTVVLDKGSSRGSPRERATDSSGTVSVFSMDIDTEDPADVADDERLAAATQTRFAIDLEISSVFKPRPIRTRVPNHPHYAHSTGGKSKRVKKHKHLSMLNSSHIHTEAPNEDIKALNRRQGRDRRREEKRKALETRAAHAVDTEVNDSASRQDTIRAVAIPTDDAGSLITGLESLHVGLVEEPTQIASVADSEFLDMTNVEDFDDDDDVFASPTTAHPSFPTFSASSTGESHLDVDAAAIGIVGGALGGDGEAEQPRLIVEALVVRKMSLGEAFLDFGGFSLT
ncbi:hypothetical protein GALMADRAFT_251691 [Galerina marginata CBS 339.88]|uniref:Uncharacterized protein n=1 Tax=Galerina marginata (strain CBS 339.88) TaxID=685588 RepID=A0A067T279_GALM3|nr:hypothetical protein GALMADRAFT_251691 [Galerina marginata CBS 339.88]